MYYNMKHINNETAKCFCKICRMNLALEKEDPEEVKWKREAMAREIVKGWYK